jgi:hypothetical protein
LSSSNKFRRSFAINAEVLINPINSRLVSNSYLGISSCLPVIRPRGPGAALVNT